MSTMIMKYEHYPVFIKKATISRAKVEAWNYKKEKENKNEKEEKKKKKKKKTMGFWGVASKYRNKMVGGKWKTSPTVYRKKAWTKNYD